MEELIKKRMPVGEANGWYLAEHACRTWKEDFIDEDTGEVVTIERREAIEPMGNLLTPISISMLQANGIEEVFVSNMQITGIQQAYPSLWQLECQREILGKLVSAYYIIPKSGPLECEEFFKAWAELNITGKYAIKKVVPLDFNGSIIPFDGEEDEAAEKHINLYYYKATVKPDDGPTRKYLVLADILPTVEAEVRRKYCYSDERITEIKELNVRHFFCDGANTEIYTLAAYNPHMSGEGFAKAASEAMTKAYKDKGVSVEVEVSPAE